MVSNQKYKPFNVGDIFFITNGKGITRQEIKDHPGELAAIQSAATNNGIMGFIDEDYCRERNYSFTLEPCLTVARTGSSGYVTFQEHGCCVGDSAKLLLLKGKKKTKNRNLLGGLYRENPVKSRNYEAVKSSKKWENVGNSYIIPALLLYRYSYI